MYRIFAIHDEAFAKRSWKTTVSLNGGIIRASHTKSAAEFSFQATARPENFTKFSCLVRIMLPSVYSIIHLIDSRNDGIFRVESQNSTRCHSTS
jgi:hypothetical protein